MISSYVGENAEFERQMLSGELDVELIPKELWQNVVVLLKQESLFFTVCHRRKKKREFTVKCI
jgi:hypothetical protein